LLGDKAVKGRLEALIKDHSTVLTVVVEALAILLVVLSTERIELPDITSRLMLSI
jgi:hypothetical protein